MLTSMYICYITESLYLCYFIINYIGRKFAMRMNNFFGVMTLLMLCMAMSYAAIEGSASFCWRNTKTRGRHHSGTMLSEWGQTWTLVLRQMPCQFQEIRLRLPFNLSKFTWLARSRAFLQIDLIRKRKWIPLEIRRWIQWQRHEKKMWSC